MAQYISFAPNVEVNGQTILAFVNGIPAFKSTMVGILAKHGLEDLSSEAWYLQEKWLNAFKEIGEVYGSNTLFAIGKVIPEHAIFPPEINNLESALNAIDVAYNMNHRNGEIGYYKMINFQSDLRLAIIECRNPYPSDFDRGIITTMALRFKPVDSIIVDVKLDENKPTRKNGAEGCTYHVTW